MVYKSKRKQRKYQRDYKWAQRHGQKFKNPWKGLEKIGTEKTKRKARMIPHEKWKHASAAKKRGSRIRGSF
jgi:hypothetical protein